MSTATTYLNTATRYPNASSQPIVLFIIAPTCFSFTAAMSKPTPQNPKNLRNTYIVPKEPYLRPILICAVLMALSSRREVISPGSPLYNYGLSRLSANGLKYASWVQNGVFYFLFGAHTIETAMFTRMLAKHGVEVSSLSWWQWMATCFMGGDYCFRHFDREVSKSD